MYEKDKLEEILEILHYYDAIKGQEE